MRLAHDRRPRKGRSPLGLWSTPPRAAGRAAARAEAPGHARVGRQAPASLLKLPVAAATDQEAPARPAPDLTGGAAEACGPASTYHLQSLLRALNAASFRRARSTTQAGSPTGGAGSDDLTHRRAVRAGDAGGRDRGNGGGTNPSGPVIRPLERHAGAPGFARNHDPGRRHQTSEPRLCPIDETFVTPGPVDVAGTRSSFSHHRPLRDPTPGVAGFQNFTLIAAEMKW
jgi:hypothetical protein